MSLPRRNLLLSFMSFVGLSGLGFYLSNVFRPKSENGESMIKSKFSLGFQWQTQEPFLFCVHHLDQYPVGDGRFGPKEISLLQGRDIGQDFTVKDGFRMYHGDHVPGFPVHPHRGFETITIVRKGYVDHADSLGAAGRYGEGDVQWMTAGSGVQHSEMFPLLKTQESNPVELFQVWLNLPKKSKMVPAHFKMFWSENIPAVDLKSQKASVSVIAGNFQGAQALTPPPDSWAADPTHQVLILLVKLEAGGRVSIPESPVETNRTLYFFDGQDLQIQGEEIGSKTGVNLEGQRTLDVGSQSGGQFLLLQAKSIGEPVVQHGPFVMTTREEIVQTFADYQRTQFGGWSWPRQDMVHGEKIERFAKYPDGRIEKPNS